MHRPDAPRPEHTGTSTGLRPYRPERRSWQGQWISIADQEASEPNTCVCFRRTVEFAGVPQASPWHVAVDSKYWLWINGEMAVREGQLRRGPTPDSTFLDCVDVARFLRAGINTIAVLVWYWGRTTTVTHNDSGRCGLLLEADGLPDLCSSTAWKAIRHPAFTTPGAPHPTTAYEPNLRCDARSDPGDWMAPGYDDAAWPQAVAVGAPPCQPWGRLFPRPVPQWRDHGIRDYLQVEERRIDGRRCLVGRLPYCAQVNPIIEVEGEAGALIDIRTDSFQNSRSPVDGGFHDPTIRCEYITRAGRQAYESPSWLSGHEVIHSVPEGVRVMALRYRETGYDCGFEGSFACSDPFLDRLWEMCRRTLYVNMRDSYMDCPDRERSQWWGDVVLQAEQAAYCLGTSALHLTRKAVYDLCLWRSQDHVLYSPIPHGRRKVSELPSQSLASVGRYGFGSYLMASGDRAACADIYPVVRDYLALWSGDERGLVAHRRGGWPWYDWGTGMDMRVLDQAWYSLALDGQAAMAAMLGRHDEASELSKRRAALRQAVNAAWWRGTAYRSDGHEGPPDDRANAMAVLAGFAESSDHPAIAQVLETVENSSPYMEKYVLEALFTMGRAKLALQRMRRRYRADVERGLSTLPEAWGHEHGGYNHGWSGGPLALMAHYVAGIEPTVPGWAAGRITPQLGDLTAVSCRVPTLRGLLSVDIRRRDGGLAMSLGNPMPVSVVLPAPAGAPVRLVATDASGRRHAGVVASPGVDGHVSCDLPPGDWRLILD